MPLGPESRRALAARIGRPVRQDIWEELVRREYKAEDDADLDFLAEEYEELDRLFPVSARRTPPRVKREVPPDKRLWALSRILAGEAARLREVASFRAEVLGGRLLTPKNIHVWVKNQAAKDGPWTIWVTMDLSQDGAHVRRGLKRETLAYVVPGEAWVRRVVVRHDGVLGRLKRIAARLPWWPEAWAVAWVLTGKIPPIPKARVAIQHTWPGLNRVIVTADPRLSKWEVANLYADARRELFAGRDKPMTERHLEVGVFLAEAGGGGGSWASLKAAWNRRFPQWAYADWRVFCRDARAAYKRITGQEWPKKGGD